MFRGATRFSAGFVIGFGVGIVIRDAWPHIKEATRPMLKGMTRAGMEIFDKGTTIMEGVREAWEDAIAENRYEMRKDKEEKERSEPIPPSDMIYPTEGESDEAAIH